jgi:hypothetical protein
LEEIAMVNITRPQSNGASAEAARSLADGEVPIDDIAPALSSRAAALAGLVAGAAPRQSKVAARSAAADAEALHVLSRKARERVLSDDKDDKPLDDEDAGFEATPPGQLQQAHAAETPPMPSREDPQDAGGQAGCTADASLSSGGGQSDAASPARTGSQQAARCRVADDRRNVTAIRDTMRIAPVSRTTRSVRQGASRRRGVFRTVMHRIIVVVVAIVLGTTWVFVRVPQQSGGAPQGGAHCDHGDQRRCGR